VWTPAFRPNKKAVSLAFAAKIAANPHYPEAVASQE
jgi:hypothetical protein